MPLEIYKVHKQGTLTVTQNFNDISLMILNKHISLKMKKMHRKYKIVAEVIEFSTHVDMAIHRFEKNKGRKEKYV